MKVVVSGRDGKYRDPFEIPDKERLLTSTERSINAGWVGSPPFTMSEARRSLWPDTPDWLNSKLRDLPATSYDPTTASSKVATARPNARDSQPTARCGN